MPLRLRPAALTIVAWLFILSGIAACIEIIVALMHSRLSLNFGALNLFVGIGLLNLRPGWRTLGLVFLWIAMIGSVIVGLLAFSNSRGITTFNLFGIKIADISRGTFLLYLAAFFALTVWQYRVLVRPDVRRLFIRDPLDTLRIRRS